MKRRSGMVDYARRLVSLGGIAVLLFVVRSGFAATYTWDITPGTVGAGNSTLEDGAGAWNTTGTNGVWTNDGGANNVAWVNNTTTPDSAIFGSNNGAAGTVTVTTVNVQDMTFNAAGSGNYTLSGSTITLGDTTAGDQTDPTITANVDVTSASTLAGNDGLVKAGTGILTLNASNSFTGGLTVNGGTVVAIGYQAGNRLAAGSAVTVNSGATFDVRDTNAIPNGVNSINFTLNGGTLTSTTNTPEHVHVGNIGMNSGATWSHSGNNSYDGERFQLNGNVTVTGGTAVASTISGNQGIGLLNTRTFTVDNVTGSTATDLNVTAELENNDGGSGDGIIKAGAGTMALAGNSSYSGTTTVNGGTLLVNSNLHNTSSITVNTGATLETGAVNIFVTNHGTAMANSRVITVDGGTWLMNSSMDSRFGNVTLSNGATWTSNRTLNAWDALLANTTSGAATVTVNGNAASTMTGSATTGIHLQGVQNFDVADVTGSSAADLTVSMVLASQGNAGGAAGGINKQGVGTMNVSRNPSYTGDTIVSTGTLRFTDTAHWSSNTNFVINGGTLSLEGSRQVSLGSGKGITFGSSGGGTLNTNSVNLYQSVASSTFSVTTSGGAQSLISGSSGINSDNDVVSFSVAIGTDPISDLKLTAPITNNVGGSVSKLGNGTLEFTAASSYIGDTTVSAGKLLVNNTVSTQSGVGTGNVLINGGTLGGSGYIGLSTDASNISFGASGGKLAPGNSPGILTVNGDVNFNTGGGTRTFEVELGGTTAGTNYDQLVVNTATGGTNTVDLTGGTLNALFSGSSWASATDKLWIINNQSGGSLTGVFSNYPTNGQLVTNYDGQNWLIYYGADFASASLTGGNDVLLTPVPEPASLALMLLGAAAVLRLRGKRRA